ncbi:MAG: GtrA family protein [Ruminococcus callidus]
MAGTAADSERKAIWETVCRSNRKYTDSIFRYCFVGGAATVIDWGVSALLFSWCFIRVMQFSQMGFLFGRIACKLLFSTFWVFRSSKVQSRLVEFLAFAAIGVVGLLLTLGITN